MASTQDYLNLISQYESRNQNTPNYQFGPGKTAQGYYQITNENWANIAPLLGIDTSVYPSAMAAPQSVQAQVATYLLTQTPGGISNWSNYNPNLAAALTAAGLQTSGQVVAAAPVYSAAAGTGPLIDLSGAAAAIPTADLLNQLDTSVSSTFGLSDGGGGAALFTLGLAAAFVILANR